MPNVSANIDTFLLSADNAAARTNLGVSGVISTPKVYYVETTGNDSTGAVGNPALPYATGTAAEAAGNSAAVPFVLKLGATPYGGPHNIARSDRALSTHLKSIIGCGDIASGLQIINSPPTQTGSSGFAGYDNELELYDLDASITTNGGQVQSIADETLSGGSAGVLTVSGRCRINYISAVGGTPLNTGTGGNGGTIYLNGGIQLLGFSVIYGSNEYCTNGSAGNLFADGADLRSVATNDASTVSFGRCSYDNSVFATLTNDYGGNAVY